MLASVRLYRILKVDVIFRGPYAGMPSCPDNTGAQCIALSTTTLKSRPTWYELGNCVPILATVSSHRIRQLAVFVGCPVTHTCNLPVSP
jgi:hypothetical protein